MYRRKKNPEFGLLFSAGAYSRQEDYQWVFTNVPTEAQ